MKTTGPISVEEINFNYLVAADFPDFIIRLDTTIKQGVEKNSLVFLKEPSTYEKSGGLFVAPHLFNQDSIDRILKKYDARQVHFGFRIQFTVPITNVGATPARIDFCLVSSSSDKDLNLKNIIMSRSRKNTAFFPFGKYDTTTIYPGDTILFNFGVGSMNANEINNTIYIHLYMIYVDGKNIFYDSYMLSEFEARTVKFTINYIPTYERVFEDAMILKSDTLFHNIDLDSLKNSITLIYQQPPSLDHKLSDDEVKNYLEYKRKINSK
ncbi:MAG: hypothetical protein ABI462_04105 [Ignavibacteria bacterium]